MERLVKFEVMGQEYPLYTDAPEEDVREILQLVKTQLEEITKTAPSHVLPPGKVAILTSLNMAGKYVRLKREFCQYRQRVEEQLGRLSEKVEKTVRD
jgi:cell division protein ZapA